MFLLLLPFFFASRLRPRKESDARHLFGSFQVFNPDSNRGAISDFSLHSGILFICGCGYLNNWYLSFTRLIRLELFSILITFSNCLTCYKLINHTITSKNLNTNRSSKVLLEKMHQKWSDCIFNDTNVSSRPSRYQLMQLSILVDSRSFLITRIHSYRETELLHNYKQKVLQCGRLNASSTCTNVNAVGLLSGGKWCRLECRSCQPAVKYPYVMVKLYALNGGTNS